MQPPRGFVKKTQEAPERFWTGINDLMWKGSMDKSEVYFLKFNWSHPTVLRILEQKRRKERGRWLKPRKINYYRWEMEEVAKSTSQAQYNAWPETREVSWWIPSSTRRLPLSIQHTPKSAPRMGQCMCQGSCFTFWLPSPGHHHLCKTTIHQHAWCSSLRVLLIPK